MLASKKGSLKMFDYNRMLCLEHWSAQIS
jgi:hypothetical protein